MKPSDNNTGPWGDAYADLEQSIVAALETYSNVHRGSGHFSQVTTHLFEAARNIVLEYLDLPPSRYTVIFCTPRRAGLLAARLKPDCYKIISSHDFNLPLGVRAMAVRKGSLPRGTPFQTGGGTTTIVAPDWVIWTRAPGRFEAGTPAIINIIAFARALQLKKKYGDNAFFRTGDEAYTTSDILLNGDPAESSGKELLEQLRYDLIGLGVKVPVSGGEETYINFDNGASTPAFRSVWRAARKAYGQPPEVHNEIIKEVKSLCATVLDAPLSSFDVLFTSNTTESINLVAENLQHSTGDIQPVVVNTILEHNSDDLPWRLVTGNNVIRLGIDREGFIDIEELEKLLNEYNGKRQHGLKRILIVAVSGASNVLGVFNDLSEISRVVHRYGAHLLVDAAQMVAHRKVKTDADGIDYLVFSGHKIYAPFGTGVLIARKGLLAFSHEELNQINKSGEENVTGITALGKALVLLDSVGFDTIREEEQALTAILLRGMSRIKGLRIHGISDPDAPSFRRKGGVIAFEIKGMFSNKIAEELAMQGGIGIRYGCHCAHMLVKHMLGVSRWLESLQRVIATISSGIAFPGVARISLGIQNTPEEADRFLSVLGKIATGDKVSDADISKRISDFIYSSERRIFGQ